MGGLIRYRGWYFHGKFGFNHRRDRAPYYFREFARQHRSRNMDYYRVCANADDTSRPTRPFGRFVWQNQTV